MSRSYAKSGLSQHLCHSPTVLVSFGGCCWVLSAPLGPQGVWFHRLGGMQTLLVVFNPKLLHPPPSGGPLDVSHLICSDTISE